MTDRYDEALRVLNETSAPDQWDDIQDRAAAAATTEAHVIPLNGKSRRQPRAGWAVWTAAAAVVALALMGAMALANRDTSSVTDTGPADRPRRAETTTSTTEPPDTTTEPDTTAGTEPEPEPDEVVPPPSSPDDDGTPSTDPSTTTGEDVANCLDVEFRSSGAPAGMTKVQQPAAPDDPRLPVEDTRPYLIGVFESSEAAERVVHVVASGGYVEDGVTRVYVPNLGVDAEVLHPDGNGMGVAQVLIAFDPAPICSFSFFSSGLSADEFRAFVTGLGHAA